VRFAFGTGSTVTLHIYISLLFSLLLSLFLSLFSFLSYSHPSHFLLAISLQFFILFPYELFSPSFYFLIPSSLAGPQKKMAECEMRNDRTAQSCKCTGGFFIITLAQARLASCSSLSLNLFCFLQRIRIEFKYPPQINAVNFRFFGFIKISSNHIFATK